MQHEHNDAAGQGRYSAEQREAFRTLLTVARGKLHALEERTVHGSCSGDEQATVLFAGVSAEPARRAAEEVARELGRDLFRVDMRALVSRFLGETEKNLDRVLETAERTGAVVLFNEGDALFGTRTGVRDAHDRAADLDVDYLLQRLQAFDGLAILACRRQLTELGHAARSFACIVELPPRE